MQKIFKKRKMVIIACSLLLGTAAISMEHSGQQGWDKKVAAAEGSKDIKTVLSVYVEGVISAKKFGEAENIIKAIRNNESVASALENLNKDNINMLADMVKESIESEKSIVMEEIKHYIEEGHIEKAQELISANKYNVNTAKDKVLTARSIQELDKIINSKSGKPLDSRKELEEKIESLRKTNDFEDEVEKIFKGYLKDQQFDYADHIIVIIKSKGLENHIRGFEDWASDLERAKRRSQ